MLILFIYHKFVKFVKFNIILFNIKFFHVLLVIVLNIIIGGQNRKLHVFHKKKFQS